MGSAADKVAVEDFWVLGLPISIIQLMLHKHIYYQHYIILGTDTVII